MKLLLAVSDFIVPMVIFGIVCFGVLKKVEVYDTFVKGAKDGFATVLKIMPTLIGLMVAVGVLRASGFLDFLAGLMQQFTGKIGFPGGTGAIDAGEDVLIIGGYRTFTGCVQRIWNRFLHWTDCLHQYVVHRDNFLYNERVLYGS